MKKKFDMDKEKLETQKNVLSKEEFEKKFFELEKNLKDYNLKIRKKNNIFHIFEGSTGLFLFSQEQNVMEIDTLFYG